MTPTEDCMDGHWGDLLLRGRGRVARCRGRWPGPRLSPAAGCQVVPGCRLSWSPSWNALVAASGCSRQARVYDDVVLVTALAAIEVAAAGDQAQLEIGRAHV